MTTHAPTFAFCLYKYFPFGGLQRDFLRIAQVCQAAGAHVRVYALDWDGPIPAGFDLRVLPSNRWQNHERYESFVAQMQADLAAAPVDLVVGFNRMPGLDVYYAADACYAAKAAQRSGLHRLTPRHRHMARYEAAVFGREQATMALLIAHRQQAVFQQHYATPDERFVWLPPGIARDRRAPPDAEEQRTRLRQGLGLAPEQRAILALGSGFHTKGLDRTIQALSALPEHCCLLVAGQDKATRFQALAQRLGLKERVQWLGGRDDVPALLQAADLLAHPARAENTGTILLEAAVAGLPAVASDACGYAHYLSESGAGEVVAEPFEQAAYEAVLRRMLITAQPVGEAGSDHREPWRSCGLAFGTTADVYSMPERAAEAIMAAAQAKAGAR